MKATAREEGKFFEDLFMIQARRVGLLAQKNEQACRVTGSGKFTRVKLLKGELDFKLVARGGPVGFFDCKSYGNAHFIYSDLDPDQLDRAILYNNWEIPGGFVVFFRPLKTVSFFSGHVIARKGARNRFEPEDGVILGPWDNFDLRKALGPRNVFPGPSRNHEHQGSQQPKV